MYFCTRLLLALIRGCGFCAGANVIFIQIVAARETERHVSRETHTHSITYKSVQIIHSKLLPPAAAVRNAGRECLKIKQDDEYMRIQF